MNVTFWEKPGCKGNARQKGLLVASGHRLEVRNLLGEVWTKERLSAFLQGLDVKDWFNRSSPRIKSGEIVPEDLAASNAINLMLADPLLIRRPLMEADGKRCAGFEPERMKGWIYIRPDLLTGQSPPETCTGPKEGCALATEDE
ncbi:Uncharacterized 15.7 kDa protein in draG 3'region [Rhodospirillaceae bacterium LM-1]|nr:Uncharacterized 15.7 kDa protein in draG 3'region [Rhodospirillaceae bacterium LM-1]